MAEDEHDHGTQVFTCPSCDGPLRAMADGRFQCEVGHRYALESALRQDGENLTRALVRAVDSLRNRAAMSRWAARNPGMYARVDLDAELASASADEEMAEVLLRHARALDPSAGGAGW
jgi:two-component system chemotaxis response regulator CheB